LQHQYLGQGNISHGQYNFWEQANIFQVYISQKTHSYFIIFLNFYVKNSVGFQNPEAVGKYEEWLEQQDATSILQCNVTFLYIGHKITHQVSSNMQMCG
jgi:hypothetical protein